MARLLRVDLKRILKDKLFLVVCIIGAVLAVTTPLLYKALVVFLQIESEDLASSIFSIQSVFYSSFSLTNNLGIIIPVFLLIIMAKDFSFGTIRNKIVSGNSRTNVFLSMFISCGIVLVCSMLAYALLTGLISLALFSDSIGTINKEAILYLVSSIVFEILIFIFIAALLSFINVFCKNVGLKIIVYVAITLLFTALYGILQVAISMMIFNGTDNQLLIDALEVILKLNIFYSNTGIIGMVEKYSTEDIICILSSTILGSGLFILLGIVCLNKKDIK